MQGSLFIRKGVFMQYTFKNTRVIGGADSFHNGFSVNGGKLVETVSSAAELLFDCDNMCIYPGFVDVHVHLREPGFSYKETVESGTYAAAAGGYTAVCSMPNLTPPPDCMENLQVQLDLIRDQACIRVFPYGTITKRREGAMLSDMDSMALSVAAFSDDGSGIQTPALMREAMIKAKKLGRIIAAHCEDMALVNGGCIHDGAFARTHGYKGISSASEWKQVERDLELVRETGCAYHVCHVSTKETVALIRAAKQEKLNVTCETAPHYLLLDDSALCEDGRFKMNPPLRSAEDRLALIEGILDGTVDMIATDHAPHSAEEKAKGLRDSAFGITGIEFAFPLLYTYLVKEGVISEEALVALFTTKPKERFGIGHPLAFGQEADFTVFNPCCRTKIEPEKLFSKGKSTPFDGWELAGKCVLTVCGGKIVYDDGSLPRK